MPVLVEDPRSFEIEKFLLAYSETNKLGLSLIDPVTEHEIFHTLINIPVIGLTFQPTAGLQGSFGFLKNLDPQETEAKNEADDECRPTYKPEAFLNIDVDPRDLPEDVKTAWVIQVVDKKDEPAYIEIAKILSAGFDDMLVIVTSAQMQNTDPNLIKGKPVDPRFPQGPYQCPIIIRRTIPA